MGKIILAFSDIEIEKINFYRHKILFLKKDVDTEKVLVSNKISSDEKNYKYFISYLCTDYKIKTLHKSFPKTSAYVKIYDGQTKSIYFLTEDGDLLEKYNTI